MTMPSSIGVSHEVSSCGFDWPGRETSTMHMRQVPGVWLISDNSHSVGMNCPAARAASRIVSFSENSTLRPLMVAFTIVSYFSVTTEYTR